jgi:hypothetical protein
MVWKGSLMLGKLVRFKTPNGMRQGRVAEQYVLHGRTRYKVQTEFGEVFVYADETEAGSSDEVNRQRKLP